MLVIGWSLSFFGCGTSVNSGVTGNNGSYTAITPSFTPVTGSEGAQEGYLHMQIPYTMVDAAATTNIIPIASVPAGFKLQGITIVETIPFAGPTGLTAATVSFGQGASDPSSYMTPQPLYQAAGNMRDEGGNYSPNWSAHTLSAEFLNTTATNPITFGNGYTSSLTAGLLDIYIWYVVAQ